jgi:hypothetical protein
LQHSNHDPVGRDSTTNHIRAGGGTTTTTDVRHYRRQPHDTVVSLSGPIREEIDSRYSSQKIGEF